ncbi:TPA: Holliday junction branch migration DNA helicase RuvB [Candidatus Peribacteria bacterium]|nr:MAG: Holliday junction DNA helicase RuvB [Candidatus Peribacteria bacterium RIFOXYC2_FULL_58_10]OGJ84593.1 MAG: Holliday junction DNA helicase RuvB [Candidatus Peribacteria bacterium RIFOXYD2_FULL_58_15]HAI98364.1 Holliday junction branch migration DNA helicase RuvB [Candidatus Peribacteria bacterium]HAS33785.1 Holliday junction branch migration DNA helicase RuvB [Candidatus Peribacteria bacterium]
MAITRTSERGQPIVKPTRTARDSDAFEQQLRPQKLSEYVGQSAIKGHLIVHMSAARQRTEPLGHTLLHGPPGLGKTTLAHIIAREMSAQIRITSGPAIEKPGDLASLLTNLAEGDVLFIDEIHRMRPAIEEVLYSAMEEYALDLVIGKGPTARSMRLELKPFTLVGATTKAGSISAPLRDRFVHQFRLAFYTPVEMEQIVERTARILAVECEAGVAQSIAGCARATPRIANRLVRAVRDFAQVAGEKRVTAARVHETLQSLGVDERGLDALDRQILRTIIEKFGGGPVGLSTIAAATSEEEQTIEDMYEPYLLQQGYLQRTPKGRTVTKSAFDLLGLKVPESVQKQMFAQ